MKPKLKFIHIEQTRHGKTAVYFRRGREARVRLPAFSDKGFRAAYDAALAGRPLPHVRDIPPPRREVVRQRAEASVAAGLRRARGRAKKRGLPFDLTLDWAIARLNEQNFRCALTGLPFYLEDREGRNPYAPSFDRIDSKGGYTLGNVRIVVFAINAMFNDWGASVFERVANSYRYWGKNGNVYSRTRYSESRT